MQIVWYIRGEKAGTFDCVSDATAKTLAASGEAQIHDGQTQLAYPENHPDVKQGKVKMESIPKTNTRKKKYPNKNMTTDADTGVGEG